MPKIDLARIPAQHTGSYPKQFAAAIAGREKQRLGDAVGLTQFGVNITRIKPGSGSALRHWHEQEDEFIYMLEGELMLRENDGETVLRPGDAAGFKAGSPVGHCLINRGSSDAIYLEVGTRAALSQPIGSAGRRLTRARSYSGFGSKLRLSESLQNDADP